MSARDKVFERFLSTQYDEAMELDAASDLVTVIPCGQRPCRQFLTVFLGTGLVRTPSGEIERANHFEVLITFPDDYLRRATPGEVVAWIGPPNVWHPNILPPLLCVGRLKPGTPLVSLIYQIHEIITYRKATMDELDALNHPACQWARENKQMFPIDPRPLKRRRVTFRVETLQEGC
ncbi:MAG: hypothetical protein ACP5R5_07780 [Armatimonadota bacterium]